METKLLIAAIVLFVISRLVRGKRKEIKGVWGKVYNEIFEWLETGWSAVLLASFIMYFFLQAFKIPTGSMRMTFVEGDHLFVNKFIYGFHVPLTNGTRLFPLKKVKRGDIVVFIAPPAALSPFEREKKIKKDFIKRCVAVGGDVVEIRNKVLYLNGKPLVEPYAANVDDMILPSAHALRSLRRDEYQKAWQQGRFANALASVRDNFGPVVIPEGHYFVMGDNRDRSLDSRYWGPLSDRNIKGSPLFIYWPVSRMRIVK